METIIVVERLQKNGPVFITLKQPAMYGDIAECRAEFMTMSTERTGHKEYTVEPNGHMRIKDFTEFK